MLRRGELVVSFGGSKLFLYLHPRPPGRTRTWVRDSAPTAMAGIGALPHHMQRVNQRIWTSQSAWAGMRSHACNCPGGRGRGAELAEMAPGIVVV